MPEESLDTRMARIEERLIARGQLVDDRIEVIRIDLRMNNEGLLKLRHDMEAMRLTAQAAHKEIAEKLGQIYHNGQNGHRRRQQDIAVGAGGSLGLAAAITVILERFLG